MSAGWLYYAASAPTITWVHESQDSGELASCAATLGITHPTGYPLYTLLGWCVVHLFSGLDPGRAMALWSVVCGAVAVGIIARVAMLAIRLIDRDRKLTDEAAGWWGALAAGFAAVHPLVWSQSVVCEVYSLALLLQALAWLLLLRYLESRSEGDVAGMRRSIVGLGAVLGLILAHHVAGAAILLPIIAVFALQSGRARAGRLAIADIARFVGGVLPGIALYLYLPIRSMQNPSLDWGNPENWTNFARHVTAWQYRGLMFGVSWDEFAGRVMTFPWAEHWGLLGSLLFLVGLAVLAFFARGAPGRAVAAAILVYMVWILVFASGYRVTDYEVFYYPLAVPVSLAIGAALAVLAMRLGRAARFLPWLLALVVFVSLAAYGNGRWIDVDASQPMRNQAAFFATRALRSLPEDALAIAYTDGNAFGLMYGITCGITDPATGERLGPREDVDLVIANWVKYDWFRENVADRWGRQGRLRFISPSRERDKALRKLVDQNLGRRPVYVDWVVRDIIEGPGHHYEVEPVGALFRIVPPE